MFFGIAKWLPTIAARDLVFSSATLRAVDLSEFDGALAIKFLEAHLHHKSAAAPGPLAGLAAAWRLKGGFPGGRLAVQWGVPWRLPGGTGLAGGALKRGLISRVLFTLWVLAVQWGVPCRSLAAQRVPWRFPGGSLAAQRVPWRFPGCSLGRGKRAPA